VVAVLVLITHQPLLEVQAEVQEMETQQVDYLVAQVTLQAYLQVKEMMVELVLVAEANKPILELEQGVAALVPLEPMHQELLQVTVEMVQQIQLQVLQ
jgi:hypothetical protein